MEVVSASPLRVGSIVWQPRPGSFVLTVVCKATYALAPFESLLAPEQDDPHEADGYWNDEESRSLSIAGDLAPFKRKAEVFLTGSAFAPGGAKVRALTARLTVHGINKAIEVVSDRVWTREGELLEGAPFARMPLRWERAAGGPGTVNPVGVRVGALAEVDARGVFPAPNLLPAGARLGGPGEGIAPAGFAPIAPSWPERAAKLHRHLAGWNHRAWSARPLPEDMDGAYFNAAPPDQQVASLPPDPRIVLEKLHPVHPTLTTSLTRVDPRAIVERASGRGEIALRSDTLWIDTDRMICTLTWRGQLPLERANEPGRVVIGAVFSQPWSEETGPAQPAAGPGTGTLAQLVDRGPAMPFQRTPGVAPAAAPPPSVRRDPLSAPSGKPGIEGLSMTMPLIPEAAPPAEPMPFRAGASPLAAPDSARVPLPTPTGTLSVGAKLVTPPLPFAPNAPGALNALSQTLPDLNPPVETPRFEPPAEPPRFELPVEAPRFDPPAVSPRIDPPVETPRFELPVETPRFELSPSPSPSPPLPSPSPSPSREVPSLDPDPSPFTLEACAALTASLARRSSEQPAILEAAGLSALAWDRIWKRWETAIRRETDAGKTDLVERFDAAYVARLEEERGPLSAEQYATLVVANERGDLDAVLKRLSLPKGCFLRIERVWLDRTSEDMALAASVNEAIDTLRDE